MRKDAITLRLTPDEKKQLKQFCKKGTAKAAELKRAQILLALHKQQTTKENTAEVLDVARSTLNRVAKRYLEEGLESALYGKPLSGRPIEYGEEVRNNVVALACTKAPLGRECWSIELLCETIRKQPGCERISKETVRLILKDHKLKP